ncbi:SMC family ATPase [Angustibacter luteus]|uniref:Nuclease SbcCD subunit C n=1 Tax=Angustibacter luteus TaxID=658456 RepID=A0ABW1JAU0_9ACTN
MRLHRLRVEAFGPFAGTEEVDFDDLAGLFLLHGPTGAGKSSVLDAVCFALYGQVPGARASGRPRLRSDHAAEGSAPRVTLEVTLAGRRLEITRSPEWHRPKKRGAGTTRAPASTDVRELVHGEWQVLVGRRSDEAGLLLKDLLGMGMDQFTKVVMLPQGEFAAFLRSGAEQRAEVLGRLFDIDRYAAAETWLREERVRLSRLVEVADGERDRLVARAHEVASSVAGTSLPSPDELTLAEPPGAGQVEALARAATVALQAAREELDRTQVAHDLAATQLASATDQARRRHRRTTLESELARLQDGDAAHQADVARLDAGRRAAQLRIPLQQWDAAGERSRAADLRLEQARASTQSLLGLPAAAVTADTVRAELADRTDALARLGSALALQSQLDASRARLAACRRERDDADPAIAQATHDLAAAEQLHQDAEAQLTAHRERAGTSLAAARAVTQARAVLDAARDLVQAAAELALVDDDCRAGQDAELVARRHWLDVRERRIAGMSAELALGLRPGEPCLVCGGTEHPAPASSTASQVDADDERVAQLAHERAATASQQLAARRTGVVARCAELRAVSGTSDVATATADMQRRVDELARAEAAAEVVRIAELSLAAAAQSRADAAPRLEAARQASASAASRLGELEPLVAERQTALAALIGDDVDVPSRQARLQAEIGVLTTWEAADREATATRRHRDDLLNAFEAALADLGFSTVPAVRDGLLEPAELEACRDGVERYELTLAELRARLADPDLTAGDDGAPVDPAQLRAELTELSGRLRTVADRQAVGAQAAQSLSRLSAQLLAHDGVHHDVRARAAHVAELSRCLDGTGGGNVLRMRLTAFVLAARLEEVAAAATERLSAMSDGRFTLVHTDELAKSGARSGLGLQVLDSWTGVARDTSTLSGGETFLASLALALGLADVVQAEAGGTTIETLFVDEGFGTLDEDALEDVMGVLDGLRDGGRTVGLVSHVRELRSRIPSQLEVRRSRTGSSIVQRSSAAS